MFEDGVGVKRDYKQAFDWYRKAADQNLPQAEKQIGYFYQCGYGVKQDYAEAHAWYLRAARHGNSDAENQLGFFAEEGWGQPKNYAEALAWFYKAAGHGSNDAEENIGYMFQNGLGVQTDYAKAMSWFVEAAAHGNSNAENQLGWMYQFGQGVKPDDARAVTWYRMSADLGNRRGAINLDAFKNVLEIRGPGNWDAATPPSPMPPSRGRSFGRKSTIFSAALPDWKATHKTKTILPTNSSIPAKAKTTPLPSFSMRPAASPPSSTMPRRQSIAPKRRACAKNWLNSKTNPNRLPTFLLPNVFHARLPERGFVLSRYWGLNDLRHLSRMTGYAEVTELLPACLL